jgi:hypothetical protein
MASTMLLDSGYEILARQAGMNGGEIVQAIPPSALALDALPAQQPGENIQRIVQDEIIAHVTRLRAVVYPHHIKARVLVTARAAASARKCIQQ